MSSLVRITTTMRPAPHTDHYRRQRSDGVGNSRKAPWYHPSYRYQESLRTSESAGHPRAHKSRAAVQSIHRTPPHHTAKSEGGLPAGSVVNQWLHFFRALQRVRVPHPPYTYRAKHGGRAVCELANQPAGDTRKQTPLQHSPVVPCECRQLCDGCPRGKK